MYKCVFGITREGQQELDSFVVLLSLAPSVSFEIAEQCSDWDRYFGSKVNDVETKAEK